MKITGKLGLAGGSSREVLLAPFCGGPAAAGDRTDGGYSSPPRRRPLLPLSLAVARLQVAAAAATLVCPSAVWCVHLGVCTRSAARRAAFEALRAAQQQRQKQIGSMSSLRTKALRPLTKISRFDRT